MEVEWGKVRDFGKGLEAERLVELPINVFDHSVHSGFVFRTAMARSHEAAKVKSLDPTTALRIGIVRVTLSSFKRVRELQIGTHTFSFWCGKQGTHVLTALDFGTPGRRRAAQP